MRALVSVGEVASQAEWTKAMEAVLFDAKDAAETAAAAGLAKVPARKANKLRRRYDEVLAGAFAGLPAGPPPRRRHTGGWTGYQRDAWNLAVRLRDRKDDVLRMLADTHSPFSNNAAERDLRMVKIQQKVSGTFRSTAGAEAFAACRSYLQTAAKHGKNLLDALTELFTTGPGYRRSPPPAEHGSIGDRAGPSGRRHQIVRHHGGQAPRRGQRRCCDRLGGRHAELGRDSGGELLQLQCRGELRSEHQQGEARSSTLGRLRFAGGQQAVGHGRPADQDVEMGADHGGVRTGWLRLEGHDQRHRLAPVIARAQASDPRRWVNRGFLERREISVCFAPRGRDDPSGPPRGLVMPLILPSPPPWMGDGDVNSYREFRVLAPLWSGPMRDIHVN